MNRYKCMDQLVHHDPVSPGSGQALFAYCNGTMRNARKVNWPFLLKLSYNVERA
jgi:hypothetical protein